jgi:hypothetical protein
VPREVYTHSHEVAPGPEIKLGCNLGRCDGKTGPGDIDEQQSGNYVG